MAVAPEQTRAAIYEGTRIPRPIPTVLQSAQELKATGDVLKINFGPEPPVHPRRAAPDRRSLRRGRHRARGGDRLPAHRLREEHGAEDVVEGDHLPRADRLPVVPEQRARLRARDREAARDRDAAEGGLDAHLPLRAEPHPLAPRLARHRARSSWERSRCSGTASASASRSSTCSRWCAERACIRATSRPAASPRTSRAASTPRRAGS